MHLCARRTWIAALLMGSAVLAAEYVPRYAESTAPSDSANRDGPEKYRPYDYALERYAHFFQVSDRAGYTSKIPDGEFTGEFQRHFGAAAGPHVASALHRASRVLPMIVAAVYPSGLLPTTAGWAERPSLGATLGEYANNEGTDPEQFENFVGAARRILAGGTTSKRTPEMTSRWFLRIADEILAEVSAAEAAVGEKRGKEFESTLTEARILAQLARFHGRRILAAMHYNLFKRGLRLAELVAATYGEKDAVAEWRRLVEIAGDRYAFDFAMGARSFSLCGHWRDELKLLERSVKELQEQCCPPDEAVLKEKIWTPATSGDLDPPHVVHQAVSLARPGQAVTIRAKVTDPSGVTSVRLRYRHVTQFEDYATLEMKRNGDSDDYTATLPGDFIVPQWDVMYFIEALDGRGNGINWPDLARGEPYVMLPVAR